MYINIEKYRNMLTTKFRYLIKGQRAVEMKKLRTSKAVG